MKRVVLSLGLTFGLLGNACDDGTSDPKTEAPVFMVYDLAGEGTSGRSYGTLEVGTASKEGEACWKLTIEKLPKALQLHQDLTGPSDPVVLSLYEPPRAPVRKGCGVLDAEIASNVLEKPGDFYIDGHNSDKQRVPRIWAALEVSDSRDRTIIFPIQAPANSVMQAEIEGTLALRGQCLYVKGRAPYRFVLPIWPHGFSYQYKNGKVSVLNGAGDQVGETGSPISMGGGMFGEGPGSDLPAELQDEVPGCKKPYWIVGEIEESSPS